MKRSGFFLLVLSCSIATATSGQSFQRQINAIEIFISIADKRPMGPGFRDTSTAGRSLNDVTVDKVQLNESEKRGENVYRYFINYFKIYQNALACYSMIHLGDENFDQASYKWHNDTVVTVNLLNSISGAKASYKLAHTSHTCCSAGLLFD